MSDEDCDAIAEFIRSKGITRCPMACVVPTQGAIGAADRIALEQHTAATLGDEVDWIVNGYPRLPCQRFQPEDIIVIALYDRNARTYLKNISQNLTAMGVATNNIIATLHGTAVHACRQSDPVHRLPCERERGSRCLRARS